VEFDVCLDFLELGLDVLGVVFGAAEIDEGFVGFFWAILLEEPAGTGKIQLIFRVRK
jgi:hypothetical protein